MSPDRDITPLLSSKLPQLRLVRFPVYEIVNVSIGVISHVYLLRGGAAMSVKEEEGALFPTFVTVFIGGTLQLLVPRVMSETFATPLRRLGLLIQHF